MTTAKRATLLGATFAVSLSVLAPVAHAEPGGCLKYGAAGAVGGHMANHHGVIGAIGGCATGMWVRHRYRKNLRSDAAKWRAQQKMQQHAQPSSGAYPAHPAASSQNSF